MIICSTLAEWLTVVGILALDRDARAGARAWGDLRVDVVCDPEVVAAQVAALDLAGLTAPGPLAELGDHPNPDRLPLDLTTGRGSVAYDLQTAVDALAGRDVAAHVEAVLRGDQLASMRCRWAGEAGSAHAASGRYGTTRDALAIVLGYVAQHHVPLAVVGGWCRVTVPVGQVSLSGWFPRDDASLYRPGRQLMTARASVRWVDQQPNVGPLSVTV